MTALIEASGEGRLEVVRTLLENQANVNAQNDVRNQMLLMMMMIIIVIVLLL